MQKQGRQSGLGWGLETKAFNTASSLVWLGLRCCKKGWVRCEAGEVGGAPNKNNHTKELAFQTEGHGEPSSENSTKSLRIQGLCGGRFLPRAMTS